MKFNFKLNNNKTYAEVPQVNPLRWKTLFREADNTYSDQSGWVKCKDFYNDTVAFFKEKSVFSIYGYENAIKKNDEGVYFLLKFIHNVKDFLQNLGVMNHQLMGDLGCEVGAWPVDGTNDQVVVLIPNELWESTYRISMVTFVIRLCNYGYIYNKWEDFLNTDAPSHRQEHAFDERAKNNAQKLGFKVPAKFTKYWYYAGKDHNSEKNPKMTGGVIHNNGCSSWSMYMEMNK